MVSELGVVELEPKGFIYGIDDRLLKEPIITSDVNVWFDESAVCEVPENLVKVTRYVLLNFKNRLSMNAEILNFILELEKKCEDGVELSFSYTRAFTQSDWDLIIENVINNPSLKFGKYDLTVSNKNDIAFNLDTERELYICKIHTGTLSLKGKMAKIKYYGDMDKLKVEGEFEDIVDQYENPISHKVVDYDNLPDIYESLNERLRRLIW